MKSKSRALYRNKWSQWTLNNCKGCNMVLTIILRNTICKMRMMVKIALMRRSVQNTQRKTSYIQTSKLKKRVPSVCIRDAQSTFIDLMSSLWNQFSFINMKRIWLKRVRNFSIFIRSRVKKLNKISQMRQWERKRKLGMTVNNLVRLLGMGELRKIKRMKNSKKIKEVVSKVVRGCLQATMDQTIVREENTM